MGHNLNGEPFVPDDYRYYVYDHENGHTYLGTNRLWEMKLIHWSLSWFTKLGLLK